MKLTTQLLIVSRLRIIGDNLPLPRVPLWRVQGHPYIQCLVKHSDKSTLTLNLRRRIWKFKFQSTLCVKCDYFTKQETQHYEKHGILWREKKKEEIVQHVFKNSVSLTVDKIYIIWSLRCSPSYSPTYETQCG